MRWSKAGNQAGYLQITKSRLMGGWLGIRMNSPQSPF